MTGILKKTAKNILPHAIFKKSAEVVNHIKLRKAMHALAEAGIEPVFLPAGKLPELFEKYTFQSTYFYDPESIKQRGIERAGQLKEVFAGNYDKLNEILELGCGDGMVSGVLQEQGKKATAIDWYDDGFDIRAKNAGVQFFKMDAAKMDFKDNSFDAIFSYNAFEHFPEPGQVLAESIRVLKPGGFLFIEFSPLFMSSFGLHAYKSIPIPYCQHLFSEKDMEAFTIKKNLDPINFTTHVNRWSVERFRNLWKKHEKSIDKIFYKEMKNYNDLNLIWDYPSCFKSKTTSIDELLVGGISALFQKKQPGA